MSTSSTTIFFSFITLILTSCQIKAPLKGNDFSDGDWLLVKKDYVNGTMQIIDDENILSNDFSSIKIRWNENDAFTTCDGFIELYKNGKLIVEQSYLDATCIIESSNLKKSYKNATDSTIEPVDKNDFLQKWDSLKEIKNCYPTIYHTQPEDKDIIWFFQY